MSSRDPSRLYLFTLEIAPLRVGETYSPLPSHLTLVSRFWSKLPPSDLDRLVRPLFVQAKPVELVFGETVRLGPKQVEVNLVENTVQIQTLHQTLHDLLSDAGATFAYPQFVGVEHRPHVSQRPGVQFTPGHVQITNTAYLIEVLICGQSQLRFIRTKFYLNC